MSPAAALQARWRAARAFLTPPQVAGARLTAKKLANLYLSRWEEARGRTVLRSRPIRMTVEATNVCNLRCPACFTGAGERGRVKSTMPPELYQRLLDELGDTLFSVDFYNWGEPLLAKPIFDMIAAAHQRGLGTTISTNFSFPFDAARAERLVTAGLDILGVSLDGADQASYEPYRRRGDFQQVLANSRLVRDAKRKLGSKTPRLVWEYHVFAHNVGNIDAARALAAELEMEIAVTKGWTVGAEWNPLSEHKFFWYPTPPARCRFPWQDAVVHNDGGVAPCCGTFYEEDDIGRLSLAPGDGGAPTFAALWNSKRFVQARAVFADRRTPGAEQHVCTDCPVTVIWDRWQTHQAGDGAQPFEPGFDTNDCFNYFWERRPEREATKTG